MSAGNHECEGCWQQTKNPATRCATFKAASGGAETIRHVCQACFFHQRTSASLVYEGFESVAVADVPHAGCSTCSSWAPPVLDFSQMKD